ncbi:MAG: diaminopimelate epimerase [Magnetococcales bacterium]|nr:diaminopimelate epimerase [Magnetococcales bacterium]
MELSFIKCHGSGNDFILIDESGQALEEGLRGPLSVELCDRGSGVGADGILFYQSPVAGADARMRIFNADGSEARMCGNGIRCLGRYALERAGRELASIAVMGDVVLEVRRVEAVYPGVESVATEIGPIRLDVASLPMVHRGRELVREVIPTLSSHLAFTALSVPNPHIVARVERVELEDLARIGRLANGDHPLFPQGVNVSFWRVLANGLYVATYERGVGLTHSCGTAMTASTFAACMARLFSFGVPVPVFNAGGKVICTALWGSDGVHGGRLAGNATFEWHGVVELEKAPLAEHRPVLRQVRRVGERDDEIQAYDLFKAVCHLG